MASGDNPPERPRRERPLRAERPVPPEPLTATTPPSGPPLFEPAADAGSPQRADVVEVSFAGPTPQQRWTVALRIILLVPHFVWQYLLGIAVSVMTVIAWFAALFTARVPDGIANFLSQALRYQTRVMGYMFFLTGAYPPFDLAAEDYAIDVQTSPGELNRVAVFFRLVLMVPSMLLAGILFVGAWMVSVIAWLLTLVLGRLPTPMWEAYAAISRYYTRAQAFAVMLTAAQPSGALGDAAAPPSASAFPDDDALLELPERPRIVRLVLSPAARRLVILFGVLAVVSYAAFFAFGIINAFKTTEAFESLDDAHTQLGVEVQEFASESQRCAFSGGRECIQAANGDLADAFDRFADAVSEISFPGSIDASPLIADARDCASALRAAANAETEAAFASAMQAYSEAAQRFDDDYEAIAFETRFSS